MALLLIRSLRTLDLLFVWTVFKRVAHNFAVLTHLMLQERLYGVPLTDLEGIQKVSENPEATLISALNTWTLSVMNCEFFHAVSVVITCTPNDVIYIYPTAPPWKY